MAGEDGDRGGEDDLQTTSTDSGMGKCACAKLWISSSCGTRAGEGACGGHIVCVDTQFDANDVAETEVDRRESGLKRAEKRTERRKIRLFKG